jgi:anion-transporting  ArsA/GET3 family ATPase
MLDNLERLQLIVVTGKGGVGKSTITAALGRRLSVRGRRVLLIEVDPRENLHHLLDVPPSGGDVIKVRPRLYLQNLEPRKVLDDIVREKLKVGALVRRVLSSPIHLHFTEGAPGLKETAVFGRALRLLEGRGPRSVPVPDIVVLDAPASGHGVSWLTAPQLISEVIRSGPVGHMAAEIASFTNDPDRFGIVAVTLAEEMPIQECIELVASLDEKMSRAPDAIVINGLYPVRPDKKATKDPAISLWTHRRAVNDRELARLRGAWSGPTVELPLLPMDPGPQLVEVLGKHIEWAETSSP